MIENHVRWRTVSGTILVLGALLLSLATGLEPSEAGHGTHTQLGLSSCSFLAWTGWPCPMCGGTTAFAWMVRGRVVQALHANPLAVVLFVLLCGSMVLSCLEFSSRRSQWQAFIRFYQRHEVLFAGGVLLLVGCSWAWKVAQF